MCTRNGAVNPESEMEDGRRAFARPIFPLFNIRDGRRRTLPIEREIVSLACSLEKLAILSTIGWTTISRCSGCSRRA